MDRIADTDETMANFLGIEKTKSRRVKRFWSELIQAAGPFVLEGLKLFQGSVHGQMDQQQLQEYESHIKDLYNSQKELNYKLNEQMTMFMIDSEKKNFQIKWLEKSQGDLENNIKLLQSSVAKDSEETKKQLQSLNDMLDETKKKIKMQEDIQNKLVNDVTDIKNKLKSVDEDIKQIKGEVATNRKAISDLTITVKLNTISSNLQFLLSRFETEQKTLLGVVKNANRGILDPYIITPLNLVEMMEKAQSMLPEGTRFPFYPNFMNARKIYNSIKSTVYLYNNKILFILTTPVANAKTFSLHKLTSLPVPVRDNYFVFVLPKEPYLLVDAGDDEYTLLSSENFREYCTSVNQSLHLCEQVQQTSLVQLSSDCEMTLFLNNKDIPRFCNNRFMFLEKPVFLQLQEPMSWIYAVPDSQNLIMTCGKLRETIHLQGSGILKMNKSCSARTSSKTLFTIKRFTSDISSSFLPRVNITDSIDLSNVEAFKVNTGKSHEEIIAPFSYKDLEAMSVHARMTSTSNKLMAHIGMLIFLIAVCIIN